MTLVLLACGIKKYVTLTTSHWYVTLACYASFDQYNFLTGQYTLLEICVQHM
jgi:hypothetical protein